MAPPELMNTRDVADYLRIKERKVYDLVRTGSIPCTKVAGKWLFPKTLIDVWLLGTVRGADGAAAATSAPLVIAGSHDPLLEWAVRESGAGMALLLNGSLDGVRQFAAGKAVAFGLHVIEPESGGYNMAVLEKTLAGAPIVAIEWAQREQGMIVARDNPERVRRLTDLRDKKLRLIERQAEAGSQILFAHLLSEAEIARDDIVGVGVVRSESDVALAVQDGKADAGFGIRAVAEQYRLGFVPLSRERYDLVVGRRDYFEPPFQALIGFARSDAFATRARELAGYDVSGTGRVVYNGP